MIEVKIYVDSEDNIIRYTISGHSGYDVKGQDIVCSAVSVLAQNTLNSLVEVCGISEERIDYSINEKKGFLDVIIPSELDKDTKIKVETVLKTLELGIKSIVENYPKYVTLKYGRCREC
ncbi:ribosomal-processing cysteine protease Prp [Caproiciproducens sp. MSJ-32]|uniref:ribosomal-processing cysteine protease Prp n=1 Tax=Caproiciproducens sp. MSJ-32 TaxID=2841527 RepID=UPI001C10853B|nr:ribosomal-processing cysteine protease Prp [Caproiciproducens sp. MSJ-32]MBU5455460.1 ribosomal-processing cysteine protease Prp [Caproiciproducens sp. MSJ-32]